MNGILFFGIVFPENLHISRPMRFRSSGHVAVLRFESTEPKDRRDLRTGRENADSPGTQFRNESFLSERQEYPGQDFIYCEERKVRGEA